MCIRDRGQPGVEQGRRILPTPPVCLLAIMPAWESTRIRPAAIWANCTSDWVRPISAIGTYPDLHLQSYQVSKSFVNRQIGAATPVSLQDSQCQAYAGIG